MINPCLSLVTYKNDREVTYHDLFTYFKATARATNYIPNIALVDSKRPRTYTLKSRDTKTNRGLVNNIIRNKDQLWIFDYGDHAMLLYGCVVVFACRLQYPKKDESITHFLLTSIYDE